MKKILIICGPTATGKTSLGLILAKKFNGEILSADSRQIYKGMDIGTGKDIPEKFEYRISKIKIFGNKIPFYANEIRIWGYDLVKPDEEFSVAHYQSVAEVIIADMQKRKKLPIVVGGTGLYLQSITQTMDTVGIPPIPGLRNKLANYPLKDLQEYLENINPQKLIDMNPSDRNNPRRLIRAIEIEDYFRKTGKKQVRSKKNTSMLNVLWIGLTAPKHILYRRIDNRVTERMRRGVKEEVRQLLKKGYSFDLKSLSAMGYRQWQPFFQGKSSQNQVAKRWKLDEHAYARRQFTWFKKNKKIHWYDITHRQYINNNVVNNVGQWYSNS